MKKLPAGVLFLMIFIWLPVNAPAKDENAYFPTPVPVAISPGSYDSSAWGFGYNVINLTSDWKDDFFTFDAEHVGDIEYRVQHVVLAYLKKNRRSSSVEYDLLAGKIESKSGTGRYHSKIIDREVAVDHSGDGFDVGLRLIYSQNLYRSFKQKRRQFIDWNCAFSLHAAYYYLEGTYAARSLDNQYASGYNSEENGIFLRPVIALQPIIELGKKVSLVPYAGLGTKISFWYESWKDRGDYIFNGYDSPEQKSRGEESGTDFSGMETYLGFDVGIKTSASNRHRLTAGGVLTKLFGENESDFAEVHVVYSLPLY